MPGWAHGRKTIGEALDQADDAGFAVLPSGSHGHTWGFIECPVCGQRFPVKSTPKNDDNDKRRIQAFVRRHLKRHKEGQ